MPTSKSSLIHLNNAHFKNVETLFLKSLELKRNFKNKNELPKKKNTAALLFFESSTRTRFSFESAAFRAGYLPLVLDSGVGTSLEKGESTEDTIYNIAAMSPSFIVIRCGHQVDLESISEKLSIPVLNAGWGMKGHPTQALLDALTIYEKLGSLSGKKVLFIGDIKHSRVVASHFELSKVLNYEIRFCTPIEFSVTGYTQFSDLEEAVAWADVIIALRVQKERHEGVGFDQKKYSLGYCLGLKHLKTFSKNGLVMHPGPINYGIDIEQDVLKDPRCAILEQVTNGVFLREALIRSLGEGI